MSVSSAFAHSGRGAERAQPVGKREMRERTQSVNDEKAKARKSRTFEIRKTSRNKSVSHRRYYVWLLP